jgi:lipid-A-disaccharide synthase
VASRSIMFIAGDPSGDVHAAPLVRRLFEQYSLIKIWGIGGPQMVKEGFEPLMPFEPFNKMGFIEVAKHIFFFLDAKKQLITTMKQRKPDCLVCVDYPGLNMPMMKAAKEIGIPVVWYIAPMVWAWKRKRARVLGEFASSIACIFPFEISHFLPFTNRVYFVGNPLVEAMAVENNSVRRSRTGDDDDFTIAIIPGSRRQEVERLLSPMLDAFRLLKEQFPFLKATVSRFHLLDSSLFEMVREYPGVTVTTAPLREVFLSADSSFVTSGTATLEAALVGIPMVIAYKTSFITYSLMKALVKVDHIGLPNIIAKEEIVPECIQGDVNPAQLASGMRPFISDRKYYEATVARLNNLMELLGNRKPSVEVPKLISDAFQGHLSEVSTCD